MAFSPPPPYPASVSITRDELAGHEFRSAPQVRYPSHSDDASSTSSPGTTLPGYSSPLPSLTRQSRSPRRDRGSDVRRSTSSSLASTEALRRLRDAEEEVKKLRELNLRLKAEGAAASGLSPTRIKQLQNDALASSADAPGRANSGLFKQVCSTDLLFLIDTTASMSGHINAAKEQVKSIVNDINLAFLGEAEVRIAVVGYKDHQDSPNIQFLDFTTVVDRVRNFIDGLRASGGGDTPEDMLGGINKALNATWKNQTRCIIHIADAPPHGRVSHDLGDSADKYATPGSEPHHLTYEPLLQQMVGLNINYALLRINGFTDRMSLNFLKIYLAASSECVLHTSNKYYTESCNLIADSASSYRSGGNSWRSSRAKLQFEEAELGTSYEKLRHMVVKNVTSSASRTAVRLSLSAPRKTNRASKILSPGMDAIREDEDDAPDVTLETVLPEWDTPGWLNETLILEGFSPDVGIHGSSTLNAMMANDENIKMSITELTINKRTKPFAQGAMRVAAYARTASSTNHFVVKSFKRDGKRLAHLAEDMRCQALCKAFALEFNASLGEEQSLDFIVTTCLRGKQRGGSNEEHLSLEPFIDGIYVKYNNNTNWTNKDLPDDPFNRSAQAFSHFTFERSKGQFLVSDLQGVGNLLTDPAIHTRDAERFKLSDTNLGEEGFKFFFSSHECNDICRKLELKSNRAMFVSGIFEYRESWPSMNNVVCCSNKLCGKILRLASSKKSGEFPGHHWCDECYPQLDSTQVKLLCVAPGPHHEFKTSRFFYESQGRNPPRLCSEHRNEDTALFKPEFNSSTAVISTQWRRIPHKRADSHVEAEPLPSVRSESTEPSRSYLSDPVASTSEPAPAAVQYPSVALHEPITAPAPVSAPDSISAKSYKTNISRYEAGPSSSAEPSTPFKSIRVPYDPSAERSPTATRRWNRLAEEDPMASRTSLGNPGFWSKIKSVTKRKSVTFSSRSRT